MDELFASIIRVFAELGLWDDGVELVGSWSMLMYQRHFGARPMPLRTQDVDFLLPWPYLKGRVRDLAAALGKLGFRAEAAAGGMFFAHPELKLEFLVPERGKGGLGHRIFKELGVSAQPLRYLDFLLTDSVRVDEGGVSVRVPAPIRFALHKLVVAQKRPFAAKREKDILHAVCVLALLEPAKFQAALRDLPKKWRTLAEKSLAQAWDTLPLERPALRRVMPELER